MQLISHQFDFFPEATDKHERKICIGNLKQRKQFLRGLGTGKQSHPSVSMLILWELSRQTDVCFRYL